VCFFEDCCIKTFWSRKIFVVQASVAKLLDFAAKLVKTPLLFREVCFFEEFCIKTFWSKKIFVVHAFVAKLLDFAAKLVKTPLLFCGCLQNFLVENIMFFSIYI